MNSVERVHTALKLGQPDRVPVIEFVVDEKVARAAVPGCRDVADCMDRLDMDGVGCGALFEKVRDNPDGSYTDEWGVSYLPGPEAVAHPLRGPIATLDDARAYTPPDPDAPHRLGKLPDLVARYKGKRAICFHHRAAFMWSAYLMGLDNMLMNLLAEPELVELTMEKVLRCNMRIVQRAIRAGAEVIILGDDYAGNHGPMMSPALFRHFVLPPLAKMIAMIHDEGALCIKHSDGDLYPLLDDDRLGRSRRHQPHRAGRRHGAEEGQATRRRQGLPDRQHRLRAPAAARHAGAGARGRAPGHRRCRARRRLHPHVVQQHPFLVQPAELRRDGAGLSRVRPLPPAQMTSRIGAQAALREILCADSEAGPTADAYIIDRCAGCVAATQRRRLRIRAPVGRPCDICTQPRKGPTVPNRSIENCWRRER